MLWNASSMLTTSHKCLDVVKFQFQFCKLSNYPANKIHQPMDFVPNVANCVEDGVKGVGPLSRWQMEWKMSCPARFEMDKREGWGRG